MPEATPLGQIYAYEGLPVSQVQLQGIDLDERVRTYLLSLVAQKENQPLERRKISDSLRALFATGRFSDLQVEATRSPQNEVSLVFIAKPAFFISAVTLTGAPKRPTEAQLIDATRLRLGELYTRAKVDRAMALMKEVLQEDGYYQSSISDTEDYQAPAQQVNINLVLKAGPPAHIGQIIVKGDPGYTADEIRAISRLGAGHTVTAERVTKALQRLRNKYSKQGRLEAQVAIVDRPYHPDSNTLDYVFQITRGPTVDIRVEGASISKGRLKKFVPVYQEHAVDDDLLNEGRRNIRDYLQTQGYFDSTVNFNRITDGGQDHLSIVYHVVQGPKHKLAHVVVDGNKYFDIALIRERMEVQPAGWLLSHGRFSQELLNLDVENVRNLYLANGFEQVQVNAEVKDDYQGAEGQMAVFLHIQEGPQTLVAGLKIEGNQNVPADQLRPLLTTVDGQPYSESNVAADRDQVMNFYFNHGFPDVSFQSSTAAAPGEPNRMNVTYTINEGEQVFVDRILTSGLSFTKPGVVRRQMEIEGGNPLDQQAMLNTQSRLYDLGVFNEVQMAVQNPEGESRYKDLQFDFQEARRWTINYGLGLEVQSGAFGARDVPEGKSGISPRVSLDVTRINFGGRAHTLTFKSNVGRLLQQGLISYDAPRFMAHPGLRMTVSIFYDNSLNVRTFTSERLEGSVQLEQRYSKATSLLYRFTYRRVRATDVVVAPSQIDLLSKPVRVGLPSLTFIRDRRDDPIESKSGNYTTFDAGVASGVFGSEAAFGRVLAQNTTYTAFRKKTIVFATSVRVGLAQPFGGTSELPLPERFFAGGGNSLRGFAINQAGPRDLNTGEPLGGNALLVANVELRLPPPTLPFVGKDISFVLFHDAGNVFANTDQLVHNLFRWSQKNPQQCTAAPAPLTPEAKGACDFSYISHSAGAGIRYHTPIGPIRLDLGYNLNPPTFPVITTDPVTGITTFRSQTLKHFNFYFSIGQTF